MDLEQTSNFLNFLHFFKMTPFHSNVGANNPNKLYSIESRKWKSVLCLANCGLTFFHGVFEMLGFVYYYRKYNSENKLMESILHFLFVIGTQIGACSAIHLGLCKRIVVSSVNTTVMVYNRTQGKEKFEVK